MKKCANIIREREEIKTNSESKGKNPYSSPRMVVYGDLSKITKGTGGTRGEGPALPKSRV